jgi:EAL domain-containing protein (putative c-di-GMP-specific phosphodiesterase class I)
MQRRSVADGRLLLMYQPMVELATGEYVGAEALLRLRGDDGELVSPVEFVPIAEETGLIVELGAWVLAEASRQAAVWQALRPDGPPFHIAVNVSTRQLQTCGLEQAVADAVAAADLPPGLLTLEITEGAIASGDDQVEDTLRALRRIGVRLSIDDFGAGYSSLGRLRHLPVDELKIDRSFIGEIDGADEAPLVDAILAMGTRLGLSVVAEGIETEEQAAYLARRSCERVQGYLYAQPLLPEELEMLLLTRESAGTRR